MAKRPSAPSTRAKQHQVIRYIYSTDIVEASKHYNVSPKKLSRFISADPKRLKSRVQKDAAYLRLYETDPKQLASSHNVKLVPRISSKRYYALQKAKTVTAKQQAAIDYKAVTRVRRRKVSPSGQVTYVPLTPRQIQTASARTTLITQKKQQYSTIASIRTAYIDGELSSTDVRNIVGIWTEQYGLSDDRVDEIFETIYEDGVPEEVEE